MNDVHKWSERDVVIDIVDVTSRQVVRLEKSFIAPIEFILDWRIYIYIYRTAITVRHQQLARLPAPSLG